MGESDVAGAGAGNARLYQLQNVCGSPGDGVGPQLDRRGIPPGFHAVPPGRFADRDDAFNAFFGVAYDLVDP